MDLTVCGIDPGLRITGYAVICAPAGEAQIVDAGVCRFDEGLPLEQRLLSIERDISAILEEHRPDLVAVEQLYAHYRHPRTSILMGHARGVILMTAAKLGITVRDYASTQVKRYLTGNGRATKQHVQQAIKQALGLEKLPEPADLADAIAIALCALETLRHPRPAEVRQE